MDPDDSVVLRVALALDQAGAGGSVDQLDDAVVAQHEVLGELANRRPGSARMSAHGEQQLVLCLS